MMDFLCDEPLGDPGSGSVLGLVQLLPLSVWGQGEGIGNPAVQTPGCITIRALCGPHVSHIQFSDHRFSHSTLLNLPFVQSTAPGMPLDKNCRNGCRIYWGLFIQTSYVDLKGEVETNESYYEMTKERKDKSKSKGRLLRSGCEW